MIEPVAGAGMEAQSVDGEGEDAVAFLGDHPRGRLRFGVFGSWV